MKESKARTWFIRLLITLLIVLLLRLVAIAYPSVWDEIKDVLMVYLPLFSSIAK